MATGEGETDLVFSPLDLSLESVKSSDRSPSEVESEHGHAQIKPLRNVTEFSSEPSVTHSVLPKGAYRAVRDLAHSEGITFFNALDNKLSVPIFQLEANTSGPVKIRTSFDCMNVLMFGSRALLATEVIIDVRKFRLTGNNRVLRFRMMIEGESTPIELGDPYQVEGGQGLVGLDSSPDDLLALCDFMLNRVTIHTVEPWTKIDTVHIDRLFAKQLKSKKPPKPKPWYMEGISLRMNKKDDNYHLSPTEVTWLDSDRLCIKMLDNETVICVSLRSKELLWSQTVQEHAHLLSSTHGRVYVSYFNKPARFTVLKADTGEILSNEEIKCPGHQWSIKIFPNPGGEGKGVVAFSC